MKIAISNKWLKKIKRRKWVKPNQWKQKKNTYNSITYQMIYTHEMFIYFIVKSIENNKRFKYVNLKRSNREKTKKKNGKKKHWQRKKKMQLQWKVQDGMRRRKKLYDSCGFHHCVEFFFSSVVSFYYYFTSCRASIVIKSAFVQHWDLTKWFQLEHIFRCFHI